MENEKDTPTHPERAEDRRSELSDLLNCPWCEGVNWKRQMFGVETNYHTCLDCFANTPPRRTVEETIADVTKKAV